MQVSSDTEPVARDASNTVTGKVQAVASDTTAAARDASNNVSKKVQGFASDTRVAARDASHTVTGKVQGLTVSAKNVANSAAQTLSDTLHYGYVYTHLYVHRFQGTEPYWYTIIIMFSQYKILEFLLAPAVMSIRTQSCSSWIS